MKTIKHCYWVFQGLVAQAFGDRFASRVFGHIVIPTSRRRPVELKVRAQ